MLRFFITCVLGGIVYTMGSIITPQEDVMGVLFAPVIGAIFTAVVVGVVLLPLRLGVRAVLPRATARTHGIVVLVVIALLLAALATFSPDSSFLGSRLGFFGFWLFYALVVIACWFWPESDPRRIHISKYDHSA